MDQVILVYPHGSNDTVVLHRSDLECLQPGKWLNDTVVAFAVLYMRRAMAAAVVCVGLCCLIVC
jgi:Ulp1 family protease